jgi:hypothetical protein
MARAFNAHRQAEAKEAKLVAVIPVYAPPELKDLAGKAADEQGIPLSEFVVRLMAKALKRPDLEVVPRKRPGRKRKAVAI